jgi:hypothetical protein
MSNFPRPSLDGHQPLQPALPATVQGSTTSHLVESAEALAHRAADKTREQAHRLLDAGSAHIRERPLQSVLVAAATGAVVALLTELLVRTIASSR